MSGYVHGASRPARPAVGMSAAEIRAEAKRVRAIAREVRQIGNAKIQWHNAQDDLELARAHVATWQDRINEAGHIRMEAIERYGYTPEECRKRLQAATNDAHHTNAPKH